MTLSEKKSCRSLGTKQNVCSNMICLFLHNEFSASRKGSDTLSHSWKRCESNMARAWNRRIVRLDRHAKSTVYGTESKEKNLFVGLHKLSFEWLDSSIYDYVPGRFLQLHLIITLISICHRKDLIIVLSPFLKVSWCSSDVKRERELYMGFIDWLTGERKKSEKTLAVSFVERRRRRIIL